MAELLDDGLDEMAARAYQGLPLRLAVTVGAAGLVSLLLPWRVCLVWLALNCLSEGVSIPVTRPQFQGRAVSARTRMIHLCTLAMGCGLWVALGAMLWISGTPAGAVSAMILWLSVVFFAQNNAYQSLTGFMVGGAIPGLGTLAFVAAGPNPLHLPLAPIVGVYLLALSFVGDGVLRSLGARRRLDEARAEQAASEARYRMLADHATDIILQTDADGTILYISPACRLLGYEPGQMIGRPATEFLHPEDHTLAEERSRELFSGAPRPEGSRRQYRARKRDGGYVCLEGDASLIRGESGEVVAAVSLLRDVTERNAMEDELRRKRTEAEAAVAAKSDFLANMTHELRTPLNAIIGFSGVLAGSPRLAAEDARHARLVRDSSDALLELVNSVLDFSRLEAGAVEIEAKPFDPAAPARAVAALLAEHAREKGLGLGVRLPGELSPMIGDSGRIRQVLLNLVSNALKFTAEGEVTITLTQTPAGADETLLRVEVTDTGIGIAEDQIGHLFDRFTQADASVSRRFGGTGLGLAIAKRTVELMGGTIGVISAPGAGSTFWFELTAPPAEGLTEDAEEEAPAGPEAPMRLLLVEDVAVNRELIATLLSPFDIVIETAENGELAIEAMQRGRFDIVLMDVQMPVMDGLTATRALRASPQAHIRATPIIAMTANVLPDQVQRCIDAGMDDHLGKPITPAALLAALCRWAPGRDAAQIKASA